MFYKVKLKVSQHMPICTCYGHQIWTSGELVGEEPMKHSSVRVGDVIAKQLYLLTSTHISTFGGNLCLMVAEAMSFSCGRLFPGHLSSSRGLTAVQIWRQ